MSAELRLQPAEISERAAADWLAQLDRAGALGADSTLVDLCDAETDFANWVAAQTAHRVAFLRLLAAWQRTHRLAALRTVGEPWRRSIIRRPLIQGLAAAACMAMMVVGAGMIFQAGHGTQAPVPLQYQTARGEMKTVALSDGTELTLNTNTSVTVVISDDERHVDLFSGEVYFDVTSDPDRPFRIEAGSNRVEVLGTAFGIERLEARVEVAVTEGTVWLDNGEADTQSSAVLKPGMIGYAGPEGLKVDTSGRASVDSRLLWREGRLRFEDTPLSEVAAEFNRYNDTRLVVANDATGAIEIGGTFPVDDVEAFARLASDGLGLKVRREPGRIVLSSE